MANDGHIAEDTLFGRERLRARAIDWDQGDRGFSSGRAALVLQIKRRIHGRNRNHASINRKALAPREPFHTRSDSDRSVSWRRTHVPRKLRLSTLKNPFIYRQPNVSLP